MSYSVSICFPVTLHVPMSVSEIRCIFYFPGISVVAIIECGQIMCEKNCLYRATANAYAQSFSLYRT